MKRFVLGTLLALAVPGTASAQELTVYSSLPLSGWAREAGREMNDAARYALEEAGDTSVRLVTLDGATGPQALANARRAAADPSAVAYIGEFDAREASHSLPILNQAGLPMISPSDRSNGTYPTGYFRLQPNDTVQAAALVTAIRNRGCKRVAAAHDGGTYGRGMNRDLNAAAARLGVRVVANRELTATTRGYRAITRARPDCVAYTGTAVRAAVRLFRAVGHGRRTFASDGVVSATLLERLPRAIARRTLITVSTRASNTFPVSGMVVIASGSPLRAYAYEAMRLILDGIAAGGPSRAGVLNFLRGVQNRSSVLGTYGFDANGDTTMRIYGLWTIRDRTLYWVRAINAG